ncbi:hypothetical protein Pcinc_001706 [Petrolisthes cinctipes]|uniref:Uncharacterized protein n=1 Tax=Petrolisthes cinctipes TaxID=88211 RepID=A0AAE1L5U8_PETCI|nr:hypothetical protein Pcinc_001706 [Petrolisthes cinctipes]
MKFDLNFAEFTNVIVKEEAEVICLRTNAKSEHDVDCWKQVFCRKNSTTLNIKRTLRANIRYMFRQRLFCLHGDRRHKGKIKTYSGCGLTVDIKIKIVTRNTIKKDPEVKLYPCIIVIEGSHNHTTCSASALRELRVLLDTKQEFFTYFEEGLTTAQASRRHNEKQDFNFCDMANNSINPSMNLQHMMAKSKEFDIL